MPVISGIEERLKLYEDFLRNPPEESNFNKHSYERRAYRTALRRVIQDANRLLTILKAVRDDAQPILLTRKKH